MTSQLDLALRKQRLQIHSDTLRERWQEHVSGLAPAFAAAEHVRSGASWLRRHPEVVAGAGVVLAVARPRALWRWARRGFMTWQVWRKALRWLAR
jgi:hypothetical protein